MRRREREWHGDTETRRRGERAVPAYPCRRVAESGSPYPRVAKSPRPRVPGSPRLRVAESPCPRVAESPRPRVPESPRPRVSASFPREDPTMTKLLWTPWHKVVSLRQDVRTGELAL